MTITNGLVLPRGEIFAFYKKFDIVCKKHAEQDIAVNGIDAIIRRELLHHEAIITGSIEHTVDALEYYDVKRSEIQRVYNDLIAQEQGRPLLHSKE